MYNKINSETDDFNRMQQKIKSVIDSICKKNDFTNSVNSSSSNNNENQTN